MHKRARPFGRRLQGTLAVGLLVGSAVLLLARSVPGAWGEVEHAGRFAFGAAFFARTFELHVSLVLLGGAVGLALLRRVRLAAVAGVVPLILLMPTGWSYVKPGPETVEKPLTILTANLLVGHASVDRVVRLIEAERPDVIFFQEYTPAKAEKLVERIGGEYPNRVEGMGERGFGSAIYSRAAFIEDPELFPHQSIRGHRTARRTGEVGLWYPQPRVVIRHAGREIVLQSVHFAPPTRLTYLCEQRVMTGWLCRWLGAERRPVVLAGDFNSSDLTVNLGDLRAAGMRSVREAGRGVLGTWPASGLAGVAPVGIDHILFRGFCCDMVRVSGDIDSDHLALVARIGTELGLE